MNQAGASAAYARIYMRVDKALAFDDTNRLLLAAAKNVLLSHPMTGDEDTPAVFDDAASVRATMEGSLPPSTVIYGLAYTRAPKHGLLKLHSVAKFFSIDAVPSEYVEALGLSEVDRANPSIQAEVWFAHFQLLSTEWASSIVARADSTTAAPRLPSSSGASHTSGGDTRKASYVNHYFKDRRFTGDMSQSIDVTIRDFAICSEQFELSDANKSSYFVNCSARLP